MAARGSQPTAHRKVGDALGQDGEVEDVRMRCGACGTLQTEPLDSFASVKAQMRDVTCLWCGRLGAMALAPKTEVV